LKTDGYQQVYLDFCLFSVCREAMFIEINLLEPPKRLSLAYAKGEYRDILELLLCFDVKLGQIVQRNQEVIIGQMRMAWWREGFSQDAVNRPKGEPIMHALSQLQYPISEQVTITAMLKLIDAWEQLLVAENWDDTILMQHAALRSDAVFGTFAAQVGLEIDKSYIIKLGTYWAIADLKSYFPPEAYGQYFERAFAELHIVKCKLPKRLRPLSILSFPAFQKSMGTVSGLRLIWHGLTGR
jgi:15-cis-phytoene synthase